MNCIEEYMVCMVCTLYIYIYIYIYIYLFPFFLKSEHAAVKLDCARCSLEGFISISVIMTTKLTAEFKKEFAKILDTNGLAPKEHFEQLGDCLEAHKMMYMMGPTHCNFFMTHSANRGGLLLSPHNAHKNAADIHQSGAQLDALSNAWCTELPHTGSRLAEHLQKNRSLIERSGGLLAPLNGTERFCTMGTGHTAAFCKLAAVPMGGKTSEKSLQTKGSDNIDLQRLCSNAHMNTMIHTGWAWKVVYSIVDETFPKFAEVAQRALNTRNHVSSVVSELETCMTLAACAGDPGFQALDDWRALAVENVVSLCIPCAGYASCLLAFIEKYGGGPQAPMIEFIDNVAKQFGCNATMGESYWKALTYTEFSNKVSKFPLVRLSFLLANVSSDKIEDGVARLLSKSDLTKVASKSKAAAVKEAEELLQDALDIAEATSSNDALVQPLGQLFVRVGLKLSGKEKSGRERKEHSFPDIQKAFLAGVGSCLKQVVKFEKWSIDKASAPQQSAITAAPKAKAVMATLSDHSNPEWVASEAGFKVGGYVVEKGVDASPDRIYTIFGIDDKAVHLHPIISYTFSPQKVDVTLSKLLECWLPTKVELPISMQAQPDISSTFKVDIQKVECLKATVAVHMKFVSKHALSFYRRPDEVRTQSVVKSGSLVLAPLAPLSNITTKNNASESGLSLGTFDKVSYFVFPVSKPPVTYGGWPTDAVVSAFWWIAPVHDKKRANMALDEVSQNGIVVPVFKNIIDLAPYTKLTYYIKPKDKIQPLQNIIEPAAAPAPASTASKRKRKE